MNYTAFFEGKEPDDLGRYLSKILKFSRIWMELTHNYIQRLFPLMEDSRFSKCDLITEDDIAAFRKSNDAQEGLRKAYQKMLRFWKLDGEQCKNSVYRHWNSYNNHNHWRMSRVLKSLQLLGMEEEYADFYADPLDHRPSAAIPGDRRYGEDLDGIYKQQSLRRVTGRRRLALW